MGSFGDLVHTSIAIGTTIVALIAIWWKMSTEHKLVRLEMKEHEEKLKYLDKYKANSDTVAKLAELVAELDKIMMTHHTDAHLHRTVDSEKRMDDLIRNFEGFREENRDAHNEIMSRMEKK